MKSVIVLQRAFLAVEFLFYSFRALSTYIFETYFNFLVVLLCLHIPTWHWCLLLTFLLLSCDCSSSLCFGTIDSRFSLYTSRNSSASWRRKACLLIFSRYTTKWSMHWSPQDLMCYRKHGQATDLPLLLYCICEPFGQEYRLDTLFCCRTAQSRGAFCDLFQCQLYYAAYSEAVHSCWHFLYRLSR